jgi:PAS domain S-box-containing protein
MFSLFQRRGEKGGAAASAARDKRLRSAFAHAPVALAVAAFDGRWLFFNDATSTILGYTDEDLREVTMHEITHPEDLEREKVLLQQMALAQTNRYQLEKRFLDGQGRYRDLVVTGVFLRGHDGHRDSVVYLIEPPRPKSGAGVSEVELEGVIAKLEEQLEAAQREVAALREELARVSIDDPPVPWIPLEGKPLAVLEATARAGRNGLLLLVSGGRQKSIHFEDGRIASCASNDEEHTFGERLVRRGLITEAQRRKAVEIASQTNVAIGRAVLILGAMREEDILRELRAKVDDELAQLDRWTSGRWAFVERQPPRVKPLRLSVALEETQALAGAEYVVSRGGTRYHRHGCKSLRRAKGGEPLRVTSAAAAQRGLSACRLCIT